MGQGVHYSINVTSAYSLEEEDKRAKGGKTEQKQTQNNLLALAYYFA
jgi:hypothetical protein